MIVQNVEEVGKENVSQIVTDNVMNYTKLLVQCWWTKGRSFIGHLCSTLYWFYLRRSWERDTSILCHCALGLL